MTQPIDPRMPRDQRTASGSTDPRFEHRVSDWLRSERDAPPETLSAATAAKVRSTGQRPAWAARVRRGMNGERAGALQLGGAAASVVVALLALAIVWRTVPGPAAQSPSMPPSVGSGAPSPFDGRGTAVLRLEQPATSLGSGFGSLWVGDAKGRLLRIEPGSLRVLATIDVGGVACGPIVPASTSLWLTTCGARSTPDPAVTVRVDPSTNEVANRYDDTGGDGVGVAAMNGLVWFVSAVETGGLTAVDAVSGRPERTLSIGRPIRHVTAGFGSLWVSPIGRPEVLRLDPQTGGVQATIALSGDAGFLATGSDAIWVAEPHQWLVGRIDPGTDRVAAEVGAAPGVDQLVIAENGNVWSLADAEAMAIDRGTNLSVDRFAVPAHVAFGGIAAPVLALLGGTVWFVDGRDLLRIDPR